MQFLETEYRTEYITSSREIAREIIPMATNLPFNRGSSRILHRIGSVATIQMEGKLWTHLKAEFA